MNTKNNRIIILDFDDTIFPTSQLAKYNYLNENKNNEIIENSLLMLERVLTNLLSLAYTSGKLYIVTNSQQGWVQKTIQENLPSLLPIINNIPIISARTKYQHLNPTEPVMWKINAFNNIIITHAKLINTQNIHILSIGDSDIDRIASIKTFGNHNNIILKCVKFIYTPTINKLIQQQQFIIHQFNKILLHPKILDIKLIYNSC